MGVTYLNRRNQRLFVLRLSAIRSDSQGLWGRMTPAAMAAHLRRTLEISLGEFPVKDRSIPGLRALLRWFVFHLRTWPQGKLKAPEDWTPPPQGDFFAERALLIAAMERFVIAAERDPARTAVSPTFGPMPLSYWRRVHGKHFDHHLRQFGV